jgi:hypothetical protein
MIKFILPFVFFILAIIVFFIHRRWLTWFKKKNPNEIIFKTKIIKDWGLIFMLLMAGIISAIQLF